MAGYKVVKSSDCHHGSEACMYYKLNGIKRLLSVMAGYLSLSGEMSVCDERMYFISTGRERLIRTRLIRSST